MKTDMMLRMIGVVVLAIACATVGTGCKAPVTFSPLVTSEININDSVKGNTVTPLQ